MADDDERQGIQSVEVAAQILRAFSAGGGLLHLREISKATDMHRGKVHRYLTSLTRCGLLYQDEVSGAYGIGSLSISLGLTGLRRLDPIRIVYSELQELSSALKESTVIAIWGEMGPTVVALQESPTPITLNVRTGSILPLRKSATGLVFEAFLPTETVTAVFGEAATVGTSETGPKDAELLQSVRDRRLARVNGDLLPGINAIAAPIFDHTGKLCLVVGIVGRQETLNVDWDGTACRALSEFSEQVSLRLGCKFGI